METVTYTLPSFYACYLINNDREGYTDEDIELIDSFLESENLGGCLDADVENTYFQWGHDLDSSQGATVCEFTFRVLS